MHGNLPTNLFRFKGNLSVVCSCCKRGYAEEDFLHLIRDCPRALVIWKHFHLDFDVNFWNAQAIQGDVWTTWYTTNQIQVLKKIISTTTTLTTLGPPREVVWKPPTNATLKRTVGGSSIGNSGPFSFGGIIRNNVGDWITGNKWANALARIRSHEDNFVQWDTPPQQLHSLLLADVVGVV
ncbi:hypothetical protein JHK82_047669 [Glycine max]|nr:hypothetical protein JHK82_047669 [Glycine max]